MIAAVPIATTTTPLRFTTPDGLILRGYRYLPETPPRAVVALAHGMNEHQGRYRHVIARLLDHGYAVFSIDHRGHGESDGPRGLMVRFDNYVDDFHQLVTSTREEFPALPLIVLGHSMGGLIATRYALAHQDGLAALLLSGPALLIAASVPAWQKRLLLTVARLAPNLKAPRSGSDSLSRNPEIERAFAADPLCYNGGTRLGFVRHMYLAGEDARSRFRALSLPIYVGHGSADKLTSPEGSRQLVAEASSTDKTLRIWPEYRHEIFNEIGQDEVIGEYLSWLDERFPEPAR